MSPRSIPKSPPVDTPLDAYRIAHALTDRPKRSGESWRVPCPAHGGDGPNLSLRNGNGAAYSPTAIVVDARSRTSSLRCASGASSSGTLNGHTPIHQTIRASRRLSRGSTS